MDRRLTLNALVLLATLTSACGFEQRTNWLVPTSPTPSPSAAATGEAASGAMVGTWASDAGFAITDIGTCGNFEWQVTNQTDVSLSGNFAAICGGSLKISGSGNGAMMSPENVNLSVHGQAIVGGFAACSFAVSGVGRITDGNTLTIPYSGETCLGPVRGTETLRRRTTTPQPPPEEAPPPPPPPPPAPVNPAPGGFDFGAVTIVGSPDVRGWPITSHITSLGFSPGTIHLDHSRRGTWPPVVIAPDGTTQESTLWVFFNINGRWYGTGAERWRPFQTDKALTKPSDIGPGWLYDPSRWGPMANYVPRPGELVGFMVAAGSTRSDANVAVAERSAVILVPFPADGQRVNYPPFAWEE
jgi:hypothetical protein